ncbi:MAG: acyltransferase, partial [Alphaproteobacteria bacterium]|nr:acyltransferase [Alphaproteobacteria bacterium]
SYPVYLIHLPVVAFVGDQLSGPARGITILLLSLALAAVMVRLVERPINRIRQRRVRSGRPQSQEPAIRQAVRDPI